MIGKVENWGESSLADIKRYSEMICLHKNAATNSASVFPPTHHQRVPVTWVLTPFPIAPYLEPITFHLFPITWTIWAAHTHSLSVKSCFVQADPSLFLHCLCLISDCFPLFWFLPHAFCISPFCLDYTCDCLLPGSTLCLFLTTSLSWLGWYYCWWLTTVWGQLCACAVRSDKHGKAGERTKQNNGHE